MNIFFNLKKKKSEKTKSEASREQSQILNSQEHQELCLIEHYWWYQVSNFVRNNIDNYMQEIYIWYVYKKEIHL